MAGIQSKQDGDQLNCIPEPGEFGTKRTLSNGFGAPILASESDSNESRERLRAKLEAEVIPRLLFAHHAARGRPSEPKPDSTSNSLAIIVKARELARLAVESDTAAVLHFIEALVAEGNPLDMVLVEIVGGAARYMGLLWESDDLDFVEVTIGTSRLQQALRLMSINQQPPLRNTDGYVRKAAFVPTKGEQHTFGLIMVSEAFRCAGWDVWGYTEWDSDVLVHRAAAECFDLAGFSLASEDRLDQLIAEIDTLRSVSNAPDLVVIVGGNAFLNDPDLWKKTGADGMASDAIEAIRIGDKLVKGGNHRLP